MSFCGWYKIPPDVHSSLFCALTSKEEDKIGSRAAWTEALQRSVTTHSRATKPYLLFEFLKKYKNWKLRLFHATSNLNCFVCRHIVSFLFAPRCTFHCVRTWCAVWECHGLSDIATVMKGAGLCKGSVAHVPVVCPQSGNLSEHQV